MENEKKVDIKLNEIDVDVIQEIVKENVLEAISEQKELNRVILNCFAECLSEIKHLSQAADDFVNILTICSNEKIADFFSEIKKNMGKEEKRAKTMEIIEKSHQKSKKSTKNANLSAKDVK
jgi:hypothetical protein